MRSITGCPDRFFCRRKDADERFVGCGLRSAQLTHLRNGSLIDNEFSCYIYSDNGLVQELLGRCKNRILPSTWSKQLSNQSKSSVMLSQRDRFTQYLADDVEC